MRHTLLLLAPLITACQTLPDLSQREPSIYIPTVHSPQLEHALNLPPNSDLDPAPPAQETQTKPQTEPIFNAHTHIIDQANQAYALRASLIDHASVSIDAQYYIWHNDTTGKQLLQKLRQAAERGVRVRLLLDDNNTNGMDNILTALNAHPNIQIRLFNPFLIRKWRALGYLADFPRVNRRMHNKTLTADNRASIIGGIVLGSLNFVNILFYLKAHRAFSGNPTLVFAGMNMGVIALGALVGAGVFKEKLSALNIAGVLLALAAVGCLFYGVGWF